MPISVFVFCVLGPISELSLVIQHLANFFFFLGNAVQKFRFFFDIVFQKNTIKIGFFLERAAFPIASKNLFY